MSRFSTMFIGFSALVATAFAQPSVYGYDLEANTPFAHVINGGPVADASRLGFAKYVRDLSGRWTVNQTHKGRPAAFIPGLQGHFWLPRGGELAKQKLAIEFMLDGDHTGGDYTGSADENWTDEEKKNLYAYL